MERSNSRLKLPGNPYDINGQSFNPDMYLQKLFKEHSLGEIMEQEETIVRDTQTLHSEMQTLVYENYNKFISATDTIRKMKNDFKQMETEMDLLGKNMDSITLFSDQISYTLLDTRQQISKLCGIHALLKKLQFLFKLPNKLKSLMEEGNYEQIEEDYVHTQQVLNRYAHLESFRGIQSDCLEIVEELKEKLHSQFSSKTVSEFHKCWNQRQLEECNYSRGEADKAPEVYLSRSRIPIPTRYLKASAKELSESVRMLLMLNEPAEGLYQRFLSHASQRLDGHLELLENPNIEQDLIELVDSAKDGFICDLCLVVTSYREMFLSSNKPWKLSCEAGLYEWISNEVSRLLQCVKRKAVSVGSTAVLVRALDRLYTALGAAAPILSQDFSQRVVDIGIECGEKECAERRKELSESVGDSLRLARQALADKPSQAPELLKDLVEKTVKSAKLHVSELSDLREGELPFTKEKKLQDSIESSVKEVLLVGFIEDLLSLARSFTSMTVSLPAILVLAKMCLEFSTTHIHDLLNLVDGAGSPEEETLSKDMLAVAQDLGDHYVKMQGNIIGQMIRKSVETRDWAHSLEPRNVRTVMRRVLDELSAAEPVASLFEDVQVQPPGSGSRHHARSSTGLSWADPGYTHHKLFSDKIEIFTPIEFTKTSILTGIVKICLKTHLECVRMKTFNKYGLQQIQVDLHYLQQHLWRYVPDESLVKDLLKEIFDSTTQRCLEVVLMVPSVVDIVSERG